MALRARQVPSQVRPHVRDELLCGGTTDGIFRSGHHWESVERGICTLCAPLYSLSYTRDMRPVRHAYIAHLVCNQQHSCITPHSWWLWICP
jgi:hypothetical protein